MKRTATSPLIELAGWIARAGILAIFAFCVRWCVRIYTLGPATYWIPLAGVEVSLLVLIASIDSLQWGSAPLVESHTRITRGRPQEVPRTDGFDMVVSVNEELREQTRAAYDAVASDYATIISDTGFEAPLDLAMVNEFVNEVAKHPASKILDAGCGAGRMVTYLQSQSPSLEVVGIDLSAEMIALAQSAHPTATFRQADLSDTQFPEGEFDGILAWYSIIHTEPDQLAEIVAEFARILRSEGLVLFGYQVGAGERQLNRPYGHDVELRAFLHRTEDVIATLANGGFDLIARLDRAPRTSERHAQGFVLARLQ